ncbi:MAG: T9SS type A sorting domain-containing protein [Bacteroidetes bacterium]|nr:T9SS type A sorting domain-containing protein [Bacteroidota bacterium]
MSSYTKLLLAMIISSGSAFSQADKIYVPTNRATIQAGIDASSDGDTVVVLPGRYMENIRFKGKKIILTSRFYEQGDVSFISSTIIDGSTPSNPDSASVVLMVNGEDSTTVLQGFTVTGGSGTNWMDEHGSGLYREGGGILTAYSSPTIKNNIIINNIIPKIAVVNSTGGGGIRAGDGNSKILNNIISGNNARYGAGIVLNYTGALLRNNIITKNSGGQDFGGGALWMNHNGPAGKIIENNTFAWNNVQAVYVWDGSSVIRNCIFWRDSTTSAAQIAVRSGGPAVTYSNIQGGWPGEGNISSYPQFSDSSCHLVSGSPCVDAGDSTAVYNDLEDIQLPGSALWPSCGSLRNDMGAYGGPGASEFPYFGNPTDVKSQDNILPGTIILRQNYPNPFNPRTVISYKLTVNSKVVLKIYDLLGREIITLAEEVKYPGEHSVEWNAQDYPSGVYYYRLSVVPATQQNRVSAYSRNGQSGIFTETKKLVLLK